MSREEKSNMMLTLVEEWQKSGITQKDFARSHEVKLSRLRYWIRKSRKEAEPEGFLPISLPGEIVYVCSIQMGLNCECLPELL